MTKKILNRNLGSIAKEPLSPEHVAIVEVMISSYNIFRGNLELFDNILVCYDQQLKNEYRDAYVNLGSAMDDSEASQDTIEVVKILNQLRNLMKPYRCLADSIDGSNADIRVITEKLYQVDAMASNGGYLAVDSEEKNWHKKFMGNDIPRNWRKKFC